MKNKKSVLYGFGLGLLLFFAAFLLGANWGTVYTTATTVASGDWLIFWDTSDTTDGADGTMKSILFSDFSTAVGTGGTHASTHEQGGADEIDGDILDIDFTPTFYTPATNPAQVDDVDQLTSHLYGIDQYLSWVTAGSSDPDVAVAGRLGPDTNNHSLRGYDGTNQYVYGQKEKFIDFAVEDPDQLNTGTGRADKWVKLICNRSDFDMVLLEITAQSDSQNYDFDLFETNGPSDFSQANDSLIDLIECDSAGTGIYTDTETTLTDSTVDTGDCILFVHNAGTSGKVSGTIKYYYDGDVP